MLKNKHSLIGSSLSDSNPLKLQYPPSSTSFSSSCFSIPLNYDDDSDGLGHLPAEAELRGGVGNHA